jgi:hypothetical protein
MDIIKSQLKVKCLLCDKDFEKTEYKEILVRTEFDQNKNIFTFKTTIPKYLFDFISNSGDSKYETNPKKIDYGIPRKFTNQIKAPALSFILEALSEISNDATNLKDRNTAEREKYIAIRFNHSSRKDRDSYNHATLGEVTKSSFQFFTVYKINKSKNSLDPDNYQSLIKISHDSDSIKYKHNWYHYNVGVIERGFQLVKWSEERELFFEKMQEKFKSVNNTLDSYLSDLSDEKVEELMTNTTIKFLQ